MQRIVSLPKKRMRSGQIKPRMRLTRQLRYNGELKITRVVSAAIVFNNGGFTISGAGSQAIAFTFDPGNVYVYGSGITSATFAVPGASELSNLYELLRIDKVEMTWSPSITGAGAISPSPPGCPKFLVAFDPNDGAAPGMDQLRQQNPKEFYSIDGTSHKYTCRPKFQRIVYQTALVSNYEAASGFVNSDSTIPHYAIKMGIPNASNLATVAGGNVEFNFKIFYTLKNPK